MTMIYSARDHLTSCHADLVDDRERLEAIIGLLIDPATDRSGILTGLRPLIEERRAEVDRQEDAILSAITALARVAAPADAKGVDAGDMPDVVVVRPQPCPTAGLATSNVDAEPESVNVPPTAQESAVEPHVPSARDKSANGRRYRYDGPQCDAIRADKAGGASWDELVAKWHCGRNTLKAIVGRTGKWATIGTPESVPPTAEPDDDAGVKVEKAFETPEWAVDVQTRDDKFTQFIFYRREGRDWVFVEDEESAPEAIRDQALDYYEERWEDDAAAG